MKRLLITGGSGFVGGHVASRAGEAWEVFATFCTRPFSLPEVTSVALDLSDEKAIQKLIETVQPDVIVHAAAMGDLDACEGDRQTTFHVNATATEVLAEASVRSGSRLIYVSTDMVFDGEKGDYSEEDEARPINVYGRSKLAAERFVQTLCSDFVVARSALIYGPPVTGSNSFSEKILERISRGEIVPLFTDQVRTPVLVQNLADALLELAGMDLVGVVHLGGAERLNRYAFGLALAEAKGFPEKLLKASTMSDVVATAPRPRDVSFDISKAQGLLKTELVGVREGLRLA